MSVRASQTLQMPLQNDEIMLGAPTWHWNHASTSRVLRFYNMITRTSHVVVTLYNSKGFSFPRTLFCLLCQVDAGSRGHKPDRWDRLHCSESHVHESSKVSLSKFVALLLPGWTLGGCIALSSRRCTFWTPRSFKWNDCGFFRKTYPKLTYAVFTARCFREPSNYLQGRGQNAQPPNEAVWPAMTRCNFFCSRVSPHLWTSLLPNMQKEQKHHIRKKTAVFPDCPVCFNSGSL